jgi:hypothetical protein
MVTSVLLPLSAMLSSPLYTVQLLNEMCDERIVSAPSVLAGERLDLRDWRLVEQRGPTTLYAVPGIVDEDAVELDVLAVDDGHCPEIQV